MLSDNGRDAAVEGLADAATMLSLHDDDPGTDGANELTGGTPVYTRQAVSWGVTGPGIRDLASPATFDVPPGTAVSHFGTWTDDGRFLGGDPLRDANGDPTIETFAGQGTYTVTNAELTAT
jgi:hypothetical protein